MLQPEKGVNNALELRADDDHYIKDNTRTISQSKFT